MLDDISSNSGAEVLAVLVDNSGPTNSQVISDGSGPVKREISQPEIRFQQGDLVFCPTASCEEGYPAVIQGWRDGKYLLLGYRDLFQKQENFELPQVSARAIRMASIGEVNRHEQQFVEITQHSSLNVQWGCFRALNTAGSQPFRPILGRFDHQNHFLWQGLSKE